MHEGRKHESVSGVPFEAGLHDGALIIRTSAPDRVAESEPRSLKREEAGDGAAAEDLRDEDVVSDRSDRLGELGTEERAREAQGTSPEALPSERGAAARARRP